MIKRGDGNFISFLHKMREKCEKSYPKNSVQAQQIITKQSCSRKRLIAAQSTAQSKETNISEDTANLRPLSTIAPHQALYKQDT
jgi:hypothetical protein